MSYESIARCLGKENFCVFPNFLSVQELQDTRDDLQSLQEQGSFHHAGTGQGDALSKLNDIRRDSIFWLEREGANQVQILLWKKMDALQQSFNRALFLGLQSFEGHYASYPEGGYYKKHRDCFAHDQTRVVSMALYLNHNWQKSNGGALRIYNEIGHQDITPIGGTLVCFLSAESEHEVQCNLVERLSFTGWFSRAR